MAAEFQVHAYPNHLASFILDHWPTVAGVEYVPLPSLVEIEHLISVCYQASLLRDEERPVRFRLIFLAPDRFPVDQGPPVGLHRLVLSEPLPFTGRELRKISPAADFYDSIIGLRKDEKNGFRIWGIVHSGPRWAQSLHGGGREFQRLPNSFVINVTNPGRITVCNGSVEVATLNSGKIASPSMGVFHSKWIRSEFSSFDDEELALHGQA